MSTRHPQRCAALIGWLLPILLPAPALGQALDATPRVTRGTCPVAHCNLGTWQSSSAVPVFAAPEAAKPAFSLAARVPFEALSGETHSVPGVHVLRSRLEVLDKGTARVLAPGDTIRTIAYLGEHRFSVEAMRQSWIAIMDERDPARVQTVRPRREVWWVMVKAPDGRTGWIDGGNPDIAGVGFDEALPPLAPASLDRALLAGLTGPVAGIASDPTSRPGPPFDATIEGAQDGAGLIWLQAGGLRMLQLRFRTLLTSSGTTEAALSGLPANQVVCCGNLAYQRLVAFTRRLPEYIATITIPDAGGRHVVEAFYQDDRLVRLLRDSHPVRITYEDSVLGRAWYSEARELAQQGLATNTPQPGSRPAAGKATPARGAVRSFLSRKNLITGGIVAAAIGLALVAAWQLWRRKGKALRRKPSSAPAAPAPATEPKEEEGWVCSYCHADVLLDLDTCWLCGHPRAEPKRPEPLQFMCACGEPYAASARSCVRCGKTLRTTGV